MNQKHVKLSIIGFAILLIGLVGVSFAFFNYTRTGSANNLGTGRIYFNAEQGLALNLSNVFPMTSSEATSANLDSVTLGILGDTTYVDGEEFEITLTNVNNTINGKEIPINFIATYEATDGKVIGTSSDDYWNARESKNANIYTLTSTGKVKEGKQVLVGYIDNVGNGVNGTLTIKAYIDADRIAISDTYPEGDHYIVNAGMTAEELNACDDYFENSFGEVIANFCQGTGKYNNKTFQEMLDSNELNVEDLLEINAIKLEYTNGTTSEWVRGRTVLTTEEWNSLVEEPISFKIRAESNEGIWVEAQEDGTIESCPNCKFIYTTNSINATWNTFSGTSYVDPTTLSESYLDVVASSGNNYFLGLVTNESNEVTNAYACGIKDDVPFCIEGYSDNSKYNDNSSLINGTSLWNNACTENTSNPSYPYTTCGEWDGTSLSANANSDGSVYVGPDNGYYCGVDSSGYAYCSGSDVG